MDNMDDSLGTQFVENNEIDIQDEMPIPKEEVVDIEDDSDPDIIEVHCNIKPNRVNAYKCSLPNKFQRMNPKNNVNHMGREQPNFSDKEEIVISDTSDTEYDPSSQKSSKPCYSTKRNKENSLSSITLNCPKCNNTKTVFSTTLTSECKDCKVNMTFICNECNLKYESLIALFRHKKIQCKKYLSPIIQFVHKCTKCKIKYKICNFSKPRNCLKCKSIMTHECTVCGKEQTSHAVIYRHIKDQCQPRSGMYYCNDCQYKNSSQRQLVLHLSSCHQNLYLMNTSCDKCGKGFANHLSLKQHKNICGMSYYYCKICPYRPRLRVSLKRHLTMIHNLSKDDIEKVLETSICPQSYVTGNIVDKLPDKTDDFTLKQLSEVTCTECKHTQPIIKRQSKCNKCKKDLAFQCLYCPMRFRMTTLLQRHSRRMHGKVEHVCNICKKPFSFLGDYNDHKKSCGKAPRFNCHLCSFKTKYRHNLKGHLENIHNTNRPLFVCQDCGMGYKTEKAMNRHFEVGCGEDLLQNQIEVDEKPVLITQDCLIQNGPKHIEKQRKKRRRKRKLKFTHIKQRHKPQSGSSLTVQLPVKTEPPNIEKEFDFVNITNSSDGEQAEANKNVLSNSNDHSDIQIVNIVSKAECFFNSENNNDSSTTTYSINEEESEVLDPLQNHCDLETEKEDFNSLETDIKLFIPYIRKLCEKCKKVTELVTDTLSNQKCYLCKNLVTTYCCVFCLQVNSLTDMYIHMFKCHYDKAISSNTTVKNDSAYYFVCSNCGSYFANKEKLEEHESTCNVSANLFCKFCPRKTRLKREMREHMINAHRERFKMNTLESILDEIVREADAVISLLTQHSGHCTTCKKQVPLTHPMQLYSIRHCVTCSTKLVYYCSDPGSTCSSQAFTKISSLQLHLRYHANMGWTKKFSKQTGTIRLCHLCGYEDERTKLKAHMTAKHPDIFLCKCDLCGVSLKNISAWKRHQATYCPVTHQKLQCGHCWFMCYKKKRLQRHLKTVHTHLYTGKRPRCNKCGITWAGLFRLRWHESRCSGNFEVEKAKQRELWAMRGVVTLS